jgi:hypothetical protein
MRRGVLMSWSIPNVTLHVLDDTKEIKSEEKYDDVNHPRRYASTPVECINAMRFAFGDKAVLDFCLCNTFKYLWRRADKEPEKSVEKACWYIDEAKKIINGEMADMVNNTVKERTYNV